MSGSMKKNFAREMQNLDAAGLLRTETAVIHTNDMNVRFRGNDNYLNFLGNDILGWGTNDEILEAAKESLSKYGTGSTSSRNSIGTLDIVKALEEKLAKFLGLDDCIIYPSSYAANLGLFEPLTSRRDTIFIDEMCNPGLFDGIRLSSANVITYKHQDYEDLEYHLKCSKNSRFRIVVTDGVFNTDGSCADLDSIQRLKKSYDAITIVDDSFGIGVLGDSGKGTFNELELTSKPELMTGTFAYALGHVNGGFVCGDKDFINWLRHTSRSYILSEPISPINAAIVLKVIEILEAGQFVSDNDESASSGRQPAPNEILLAKNKKKSNVKESAIASERIYSYDDGQSVLAKLYSNSKYIKNEMLHKNFNISRSDYPFVSVNVGSTLNAQKIVEYLFEKNILVSALCYPNTPEGASVLRINLSVNHTEKQIDQLINAIGAVLARKK